MSILVRVGIANRMRDVGHLLRSTPHLRIKQVLNRERRIEVAARLSGFDADEIAANTPVRMTGNWMSVAGEAFSRHGTLPGRACPLCIDGDLQAYAHEDEALRPYRRGWWQVPAISTCPWHRVALVAACGACGHKLDERRPSRTCRCGTLRLKGIGVPSDACAHDEWLLGRLGLAPGVGATMLDAMPPGIGSELCRVIGASARGERLRGASHGTAALLAETRSVGWRLLRDGQPALERLLDDIVERNRGEGSVCNTGYGSLHRFLTLNASPALDGVRELVAEHARSNVGLSGSRSRLFGRAVVDGERLSVTQASKVLNVGSELLCRVLLSIESGFEVQGSGPTLLSRAQLLAARDAIRNSTRSPEAKAVLGFEKKLMQAAIGVGMLEYVVPPARAGLGLVRRHGVERLLRLFARVPVRAPDGLVDARALARLGEVSMAEVMLAVSSGSLVSIGRLAAATGFRSLLFDPSAAADIRISVRGEVSKQRAHGELGWMPSTISALQGAGLMEASGAKTVVLSSLAGFRAGYATAQEALAWLTEPPATQWALFDLIRSRCGAPDVGRPQVTAFWSRGRLLTGLAPLLRPNVESHAIGFGAADWIRNRGL